MNYPKGYYSIKDKISVLMGNPQTAQILQAAMASVMGQGTFAMASGEGSGMGKEMQEFMGMMTLANMLKMAGGAVSADAKYELNEMLNKIAK